MNVSSFLNNAFDSIVEASDSLLDGPALTASILPDIDFGDVLTDVTKFVVDEITAIDQVIETSTQQVVTALGDVDVAANTVDVSAVVEDLVNAITALPEDTTFDSLLNEIEVPFLSDEQLQGLINNVGDLLDNIAPNLSQLSLQPVLAQGAELLEDLPSSVGTITIDGSSLSGDLTIGGTVRTFTTDLSDDLESLVADVNDFLADTTGSASLADGQFIGDVTIGTTQYEFSLDITKTLTTSLVSLFSSIDTPLTFTDGAVAIDIDTAFGDIDGTIDFAGGDLDVDLTTPFGTVDTSIDFPDNAQFEFPVELGGSNPLNLELDLAAGVVSLPILGGLDIALETFSGEIGFTDNLATLSLDLGLPAPVESTFEIGPLADFIATELIEDFSGDLTLDAGVIDGTIASRFGDLPVSASLSDALLQATAVIDQTTGSLTLNDGIAGISLDTPLGELVGNLALSPIADTVASLPSLPA